MEKRDVSSPIADLKRKVGRHFSTLRCGITKVGGAGASSVGARGVTGQAAQRSADSLTDQPLFPSRGRGPPRVAHTCHSTSAKGRPSSTARCRTAHRASPTAPCIKGIEQWPCCTNNQVWHDCSPAISPALTFETPPTLSLFQNLLSSEAGRLTGHARPHWQSLALPTLS